MKLPAQFSKINKSSLSSRICGSRWKTSILKHFASSTRCLISAPAPKSTTGDYFPGRNRINNFLFLQSSLYIHLLLESKTSFIMPYSWCILFGIEKSSSSLLSWSTSIPSWWLLQFCWMWETRECRLLLFFPHNLFKKNFNSRNHFLMHCKFFQ